MSKDRKTELLEACLKLLKKANRSTYVLDVMSETLYYDGAECDGHCLMEDIESELDTHKIRGIE